jgi:dTDP-4-amino-4,6-dideoxygalactose transaminase
LTVDWTRDRILPEISALGVPCYSRSCTLVYLEKAFDDTRWRLEARLSIAKEPGEASLMFLVHPALTEAEIEKNCEVICSVMQQVVKP